MISIKLEDGTVVWYSPDDYKDCFLHEMGRLRRHYHGQDPGECHPLVAALRQLSDEDMARVVQDHGKMLGHLVGEDRIIRGEIERPGPKVRETSPRVYE